MKTVLDIPEGVSVIELIRAGYERTNNWLKVLKSNLFPNINGSLKCAQYVASSTCFTNNVCNALVHNLPTLPPIHIFGMNVICNSNKNAKHHLANNPILLYFNYL